MVERFKIVDLGFSVADAEDVSMKYDGSTLFLTFTDWQEQIINVTFENTIAFKYQEAEYYLSDAERFDCCHLVENSEWLKLHINQSMTWDSEAWDHYKLNFNADGIFEVLCSNISVQ